MCNVKIQIHLYETYIKFSFTLIFDELYIVIIKLYVYIANYAH